MQEGEKDPGSLDGDVIAMPSSGPVDQKTTLQDQKTTARFWRQKHCSSSSLGVRLLIVLGGGHKKPSEPPEDIALLLQCRGMEIAARFRDALIPLVWDQNP